ncbi:hypothetical protein EC957_005989 [Mortierella hygrophila]|uniref:Uncharacterized protein n=1 Tax=Mortierella hygrophila TaxID=979708 RepID=A0A9P6EYM0_9FUNG|nr:hypothetical protein EC957_005989 [Mortierella hygrophila]
MASGKRKGDAIVSEFSQGSATKQARMSVSGKNRGPQPAGIETPTTTKARRQTQRQTASKSSEQQAAATMKHPIMLQLERAHTRILQETMDSIRKGGSQIQQELTTSLATQSERTYESLRTTIDLFNTNHANLAYANSGSSGGSNNNNNNNNNKTTAIPLTQISAASSVAMHLVPALKMVVEEHTEAVTRIATELNQWTVALMSTLAGTSLSSGRTLRVDSLATILVQQQQQQYSSSSRGSGSKGAPPSPVSPTTASNSQQQQRQSQFRFDRKATTIRRMLEECQRYKVCKYQDRYLGYDKATQFHSYRAEERYIQARMVVFEEVRVIMETRGENPINGGAKEEEEAIGWLEREFLKMDGSTTRFLEILKERQKLRKSQVRRV